MSRVADGFGLAATPTFAGMALFTALQSGPAEVLCMPGSAAAPLSGMVTMYLLMSLFHAAPWLRMVRRWI